MLPTKYGGSLIPHLWELTYNPWVVLQTVSRDKLRRVSGRSRLPQKVDDLCRSGGRRRNHLRGFSRIIRRAPLTSVAYFSMEFMLSEALAHLFGRAW